MNEKKYEHTLGLRIGGLEEYLRGKPAHTQSAQMHIDANTHTEACTDEHLHIYRCTHRCTHRCRHMHTHIHMHHKCIDAHTYTQAP
jgi:hypothetical protein